MLSREPEENLWSYWSKKEDESSDEEDLSKTHSQEEELEDETQEMLDDLALDASFYDDENDLDSENIEEVNLGPAVSIPPEGGFEIIQDLKQWLKSPWNPFSEEEG